MIIQTSSGKPPCGVLVTLAITALLYTVDNTGTMKPVAEAKSRMVLVADEVTAVRASDNASDAWRLHAAIR